MRTLARAVTYTLFATVIAMSLSVTWTTGLFWWVIALCVAAGICILAAKWVNAGRMIDAAPGPDPYAQDVARYHCAAHGCSWHLAEGDRVYVCGVCGARVVRDADLYDRENGVA